MSATKLSFTPKDVMALREKTGLGMMDCKAALTEAGGDMKKAEEILRTKLKGKMDTRTERVTAEGRIGIAIRGADAAIVEIRTETDFTARNPEFQKLVDDVANAALKLPAGPIKADAAITKRIDDVRIKTGENVNFSRGEHLKGGSFGTYLHHDGKRGALVQIDGPSSCRRRPRIRPRPRKRRSKHAQRHRHARGGLSPHAFGHQRGGCPARNRRQDSR